MTTAKPRAPLPITARLDVGSSAEERESASEQWPHAGVDTEP
jgi:hypothetical protein